MSFLEALKFGSLLWKFSAVKTGVYLLLNISWIYIQDNFFDLKNSK